MIDLPVIADPDDALSQPTRARLFALLSELRSRRAGLRGMEETGREIGRELAPPGGDRGPDSLGTALTALGFQPTVKGRESDRLTICLGNCPYRDVVRENQRAICALHRGITRGLLDVLEPQARLTGFVPHDPDRAGCEIELRGVEESGTARTSGG